MLKRHSARLWITVSLLVGAWFLLNFTSRGEATVPRRPLKDLPYALGPWTGQERPLGENIVRAVGVSDYTNRIYFADSNTPLQLYIGYYENQRTGDTIHSPKNCLPGSGWDPIRSGYATLTGPSGQLVVVNEYVIQRDQDKELVFYWYQGRGRVIASEYSAKFWMMADAVARNRTDGSLVRIITSMNEGEAKAYNRLMGFATILFASLDGIIPK